MWALLAAVSALLIGSAHGATLTITSISPSSALPGDSLSISWTSSGATLPIALYSDAFSSYYNLQSASGSTTINTPRTARVGATTFYLESNCFFGWCDYSPSYRFTFLAPSLTLLSSAPVGFVAGTTLSVAFSASATLLAGGVTVRLQQTNGLVVCLKTVYASPYVFPASCTVALVPSFVYTFSVAATNVATKTSSPWTVTPYAEPTTCSFSNDQGIKAVIFSSMAYWDFDVLKSLTVARWNNPTVCPLCVQVGAIASDVAVFRIGNSILSLGQVFVVKLADGTVVVSFRGTTSPLDVFADLVLFQEAYVGCAGCRLHAGFYRAYALLAPFILQQLQALIPPSAMATTRVFFTGHSLGAAWSTISAHEFALLGYISTQTSIASPRVGNPYYANAWNAIVSSGSTALAGKFQGAPLQSTRRRMAIMAPNATALTLRDTPVPQNRPSAVLLALAQGACGECGGLTTSSPDSFSDDEFWARWDAHVAGLPLVPIARASSRALAGASGLSGWPCGTFRVVNWVDPVPEMPQPSMGGFQHVGHHTLLTLDPAMTVQEKAAATGVTSLIPSACETKCVNSWYTLYETVCSCAFFSTGIGSASTYPELLDATRLVVRVAADATDFQAPPNDYYTNQPWPLTTYSGWIDGDNDVDVETLTWWLAPNVAAGYARGKAQGNHGLPQYAYRLLPAACVTGGGRAV